MLPVSATTGNEGATAEPAARTTRWRSVNRYAVLDVVVIAAAWIYMSMRVLLSGIGFDDVTYSTPSQQVTLDAWRHGRMALWSDTIFGGTPQLGNLFSAGLYPLHWLAAPFPDLLGTDMEMVSHLLIFGLGFYALGRLLGLARPAPAAMAVAAMWSGATLFRVTLLLHFPPLVWVPWAAICIYLIITSARPRRAAAALAVVVWCIITSGHPQSILMAATLLGAWTIGLMIEHRQWRRAGWFAPAGGLALVMAAPVLLAARESIAAAAAAERDSAALMQPLFVMPLRQFPRLLLGQPMSGLNNLLGGGERITFAGAAVVALAIVGCVTVIRTRRWSLISLMAVAAFAASLSLGLRSPTMTFARAFLPGFDQPRVSARWNWVLVMVLILLAGFGIDRLCSRRATAEGAAVVAVTVGLAAAMWFGVERGGTSNELLWLAIAVLVAIIAFVAHSRSRAAAAGLLVVLAVFELAVPINWLTNWHDPVITSTSELVGPGVEWLAQRPGLTLAMTNEEYEPTYLVQGMRPNANSILGIRSIDGYDGGTAISRRWHAALLQIIPTINDLPFRGQAPYVLEQEPMARLGVHYVMFDPTRGSGAEAMPGWTRATVDGRFEIYANPLWKGDATVWYAAQLVASPEDAGNSLRADNSGRLTDIGLVEDASAVLSCSANCAPDGFTTSSDYSGHREVNVVAAQPAVVAINEQFDTGWTVSVDGHEQQVIPVDGMWTGVQVTAGPHHIVLRYDPPWLNLSLVIMALGWLGVVCLYFWPDRRRRNRPMELPMSPRPSDPTARFQHRADTRNHRARLPHRRDARVQRGSNNPSDPRAGPGVAVHR